MNRIFRTLLLLFACGTSLLQSGVLAQNVTVVSTVETTTNATLTDITTLDVSQVNNANLSLSTLRSTTVNSEVLSSTLASDTVPIATLVSSTVPTATVGSTSVPVSTLASDTVPNATLVSSTVPTSTLESTSGPVSTLATRLTTNGVIVETGRINSTQNLNSTRTTGFQIIINEPKELNETAIKKNKSSLASSYPADFLPDDIRNNGGVIIHILILVYISLSLGIVCDLYFLSSLEIISNALKLPSDIAGATFMAIGTSAPELFTSLIGVFISEDDIGTGTILGSAVFNLIFIPAACGIAAYAFNVDSTISKFSILRDSFFYLITTTILLLSLKDNEVDWIESLCMLMMFVIYLVIMYFNAKFSEFVNKSETSPGLLNETTPLLTSNKLDERDLEKEYRARTRTSSLRPRLSSMNEDGSIVEELNWIESNVFVKWLLFPACLIFKLTIPKPTKCCFLITFLMSIIWISILTYLAVWMVVIIGDTFGIPETVGGLTILAAGTSFPELISSVLVLKRAGLADMAICNSIGSNIFDILVCLALPWFIKSVISMVNLGTISLDMTSILVQSNGLPMTTFTLLITILALMGSLSIFKWKIGLGIGITCSLIYAVFIVVASILEISLN